MKRNDIANLIGAAVLASLIAASPLAAAEMKKPMGSMPGMSGPVMSGPGMSGMTAVKAPVVPPVAGYSEGQEITFLHTEASDRKIAKILTDMMGSPVLVVPALARTPRDLVVPVYVFTNGPRPPGPMGPLGFQPDVFPDPPGSPGYRPLRTIVLVTWSEGSSPRVLKSASEVRRAIAGGEAKSTEPGIVVNMPFLTWPGGHR